MPGTVTLLVNTGTPDSPDKTAVKEYLSEFLNDPYMMGMPDAVRRVLVDKIIVPGRVGGSAARYRDLFAQAGGRSPLAVHSEALAVRLSGPSADERMRRMAQFKQTEERNPA